MTLDALAALFERDIKRIEKELLAYENEADMWKLVPGISNSAGNLALHLTGNLQHFIGAILGNTGYVRNREAEFNDKDVPRSELQAEIHKTSQAVLDTLGQLNPDALDQTYPLSVLGKDDMTVAYFLIHLSGHLSYHLGQINYHRRLL